MHRLDGRGLKPAPTLPRIIDQLDRRVEEGRHRGLSELESRNGRARGPGGLPVTEVVPRYGIAWQTVHRWLRRYEAAGLPGLAGLSSPCELSPPTAAPTSRSALSSCGGSTYAFGAQA